MDSQVAQFSSVQSLSHVRFFVTPWTAACQDSLSITNFWSLLKHMSIDSMMTSNHLIFCRPLLLLPSIFPSIRVFSNESVLRIRWPKYWSFSFSIVPSRWLSGKEFACQCWRCGDWSLTQEDRLKKKMATHSSIPVWIIPWTEEPGRLQSWRHKQSGHGWVSMHRKKSSGSINESEYSCFLVWILYLSKWKWCLFPRMFNFLLNFYFEIITD